MKLEDIAIRDPFILADKRTQKYYLYGTFYPDGNMGFWAYESKDMKDWKGPVQIFKPGKDFWADQDFWAPEIYFIKDSYYMVATFKSENRCRSCQILKAENPLGPYTPYSDILTPKGWEALDGTLGFEDGHPFLIFSHEWLQIKDGTICSIRLSDDLKHSIGEATTLFKASNASWSGRPNWNKNDVRVTDGPFIYRGEGRNALLWSTYNPDGYTIGVAYPQGSFVKPDYVFDSKPLPIKDSGHGMVFKSFSGESYLIVHREKDGNSSFEHALIFNISINQGGISLKEVNK